MDHTPLGTYVFQCVLRFAEEEEKKTAEELPRSRGWRGKVIRDKLKEYARKFVFDGSQDYFPGHFKASNPGVEDSRKSA